MANFLEMLGIPSPTSAAPLPADLVPGYGGPMTVSPPPPQVMQMPSPQMPPDNALQAVQDPVAPPMPQAQPMQAPPPTPTPAEAVPTRPRARSSILDAIGRVSDVLARVGGAEALYQPTLNALQDRDIAAGDHSRKVDMDKLAAATSRQALEAGAMTNEGTRAQMVGHALRGLQAIKTANPNADVSQIWPALAKQAGIPDDQAAVIGQAMTTHPELIQGLITAATDPKLDKVKYGFQPIYTKDAQGGLHVHQLSDDGTSSIPEGEAPIDPFKPIDLGGSVALMGTRSGTIAPKILPKTEAPGKALDRTQRGQIAAGHDTTSVKVAEIGAGSRITVAGMPARSKPAAANGGASDAKEALIGLDQIQRGFDELHGMKALPGDGGGAVDNVLSALGRTGIGQKIGEQAGSAAAQKRLELGKNINTLQQTLIKALPASATRTKFEQEILRASLPDPSKMSYSTAKTVISQYKDIFRRAQAAAAAEQRRPAAAAPVKPNSGASTGWKLVGVNK
jgi:hypothetical protein